MLGCEGRVVTENYWQVCADPTPMLAYLRGRASGRKLRLFACACARREWDRLDAPGRWAIQAAERAAEGEGPEGELWAAHVESHGAAVRAVAGWGMNRRHDHARFAAASCAAPEAADAAVMASQDMLRLADERLRRPGEEASQVAAIRCVFGDQFRPVAVDPVWLTSTVLAMARQVYDSREFGVLPILADALQDAGCGDEELLAHCRREESHVKGCWALDLVLGKA
jgi:hypothetical protein